MVNVPKSIFWTSLLLTVLIFGAGLLIGTYFDSMRSDQIYEDLRANELDTESYLVGQSFWDTFGGDDCEFSEQRLNSISFELANLGQYLNSYEKKSLFADKEYEYLARRYFLLEIKGYILFNNLKENCNVTSDVILFFYSPEDSESEKQGYVLDKAVQRSNSTLDIFSINKNYEGDESINTLLLYYNITTAPTLIINGEKKKEGYIGYSELMKLLEENY